MNRGTAPRASHARHCRCFQTLRRYICKSHHATSRCILPQSLRVRRHLRAFFFTGFVVNCFGVCGYSLFPLRHIFRGEAVGKVHKRHVKRFALALGGRHHTAPQICAKVRETVGLNLGDLSARFLLETEHSPHSGATGICCAVYVNLNAPHYATSPGVSGVSVMAVSSKVIVHIL